MSKPFKRRNLPLLLLYAREVLMSDFRPILNKYNISEQQWRVLRTLHEHPNIDAANLANESSVLAPSLTRMLKLLESKDIIARKNNLQDQRRQEITLTDLGTNLVLTLQPQIDEIYNRLETSIGTDLLADIYTKIDQLIINSKNTRQ